MRRPRGTDLCKTNFCSAGLLSLRAQRGNPAFCWVTCRIVFWIILSGLLRITFHGMGLAMTGYKEWQARSTIPPPRCGAAPQTEEAGTEARPTWSALHSKKRPAAGEVETNTYDRSFIAYSFIQSKPIYSIGNLRRDPIFKPVRPNAMTDIKPKPTEPQKPPPLGGLSSPLLPQPFVSGTPQPQTPGAVLFGSEGHKSMQSGVPSPSVSVSGTPQPQIPGAVLFGSKGHKSPGLPPQPATSGTPQPQVPGAVLFGSKGHKSMQSGVPSPSVSVSGTPQPQIPGSVLFGSKGHKSTGLPPPAFFTMTNT